MVKLLFCLFVISCTNQEMDGPDVISKAEAEDRFNKIFSIQLGQMNGALTGYYNYLFPIGSEETHNYCIQRSFYWTKSVDFCEELLYRIEAKNLNELYQQTVFTKEFLCDLEEVKILNDKKPLQGEIDNCQKWSQPYYDMVY